jgi:NTE family protein
MDVVLALGGGGIKGIAHIGVIAALEKAGYHVRAIAGTSAGALVGALYAAGQSTQQISELVTNLDRSHLFSRLPQDNPSLLGLSGMIKALSSVLGDKTFSSLNMPFACCAVDINTYQEFVLHRGRVLESVLASSAVPGVFPSQQFGKASLIDGGVLDPVPVSVARWLAPDLPIVASVLSPVPNSWSELHDSNFPIPSPLPDAIMSQVSRLRMAQAFQIFVQSVDISSRMLTELRLQVDKPDVIVRPEVHQYGMLDNVAASILMQLGEQAVENSLPDLTRATSWANQLSRRLRRSTYNQIAPVKV